MVSLKMILARLKTETQFHSDLTRRRENKQNKIYPSVIGEVIKDYIATLKDEIKRMRKIEKKLKAKQHETLCQLNSARYERDNYCEEVKELKRKISELERQNEGF